MNESTQCFYEQLLKDTMIKKRGLELSDECGSRGTEENYINITQAATGILFAGSLTLFSTIPQGTSATTRVGKKCFLQRMQIRGQGQMVGGADYSNRVALLLVYDRRPRSTLPAITDILDAANADSLRNEDNRERFQVLWRKDLDLQGRASVQSTATKMMELIEETVIINCPVVYKALGTGAIADHEQGALYLVQVMTAGQLNFESNTVQWNARVFFTEDPPRHGQVEQGHW